MKISKRDAQLLIVLGSVLIFVALYFLVHSPLRADIDALEAENNSLQPQLQLLEEHYAQVPTYESKITEVGEFSDDVLSEYPAGVKEEDFLVWFLGMENAIGYDFTNISFQQPVTNLQFQTYLDVEGVETLADVSAFKSTSTVTGSMTYSQLKEGLDYVYDYEYRTAVDNVTVSYDATNLDLATTLTVSKYYLEYPGAEYEQSTMPTAPLGVPDLFGAMSDD